MLEGGSERKKGIKREKRGERERERDTQKERVCVWERKIEKREKERCSHRKKRHTQIVR